MFIEMRWNKDFSSSVKSGMFGGEPFALAHAAPTGACVPWGADTIIMALLRSCHAKRSSLGRESCEVFRLAPLNSKIEPEVHCQGAMARQLEIKAQRI